MRPERDPMMMYDDREEDQYERLRLRVPIDTYYPLRGLLPIMAAALMFWIKRGSHRVPLLEVICGNLHKENRHVFAAATRSWCC